MHFTKEVHTVKETNQAHLNHLAYLGQMATGIAHEVRNPLTAVKGFLQLFEEQSNPDYIHIAKTELNDALATLDNLLQVAKPDPEDETRQSISLSVELENVLSLFQNQSYNIVVKKVFNDTGATIYGKKNHIKKALFNLVKNAFESIEGKGTITLRHDSNENYVVVSIEDTGVGIPKEQLSLLGTPFFSTKTEGTGMGLAWVHSVIHNHGGYIQVKSEENVGTTFTIVMPSDKVKKRGVVQLTLDYSEGLDIKDFFLENRKTFEKQLLTEAVNVRDKIEEIHETGNIDLVENAYKLVIFIVEEREHELIRFAQREGVAWAKHSLTLAFKLEWIQAIRRTVWDFLFNFDRLSESLNEREEFYKLEKRINESFDQFLYHFFINYSKFKDELIASQREMVERLSVPIIPITPSTSILPLIGQMDLYRMRTIEDQVIEEVGKSHIQTLIIDLSGIVHMEIDVIQQLLKILDGLSMMGCKTVITGIRPEVVKAMIHMGLSFEQRAETKGTMQQALLECVFGETGGLEGNPPVRISG
ncbi:ATP-binding protein [Kroppenstedtia sanguinis]|uniref:histidine kinase n=1 Tax=Kroppenstedtia sanguinis TaxID=1380684 RepID=A0ABW4C6I9_9BACL